MEPLAALRDRAGTSRLAILSMLHEAPGTSLSDIARRLGVSVQAVSAHGKRMVQEGVLAHGSGGLHVTPTGLQQLHDDVRNLQAAVQGLVDRLAVIHAASAVATAPVTAGERVSLFMRDGDLAAIPGDGPSTGTAQHDAAAGDEVVVTDLRGIVELSPGHITVLSLPGPDEGGARTADPDAVAARIDALSPDRVAALGTGARLLSRRLGHAAMEFAAAEAAFNAAERGLHVLVLATRDRVPEALSAFDRGNQRTLHRVPVGVHEVGA